MMLDLESISRSKKDVIWGNWKNAKQVYKYKEIVNLVLN